MQGTQSAIVVGPKGEEIHDGSRVKLHFLWDRRGKLDGSDSMWVRVSQPCAKRVGAERRRKHVAEGSLSEKIAKARFTTASVGVQALAGDAGPGSRAIRQRTRSSIGWARASSH